MYQTPIDQVAHVIRVVETLLGRTFAGSQRGNQEKAVLGQAVERLYEHCGGMGRITSENAPTMEDLAEELYQVGDKRHTQELAQALADEIGGLAAGAGPYAGMLNGRTNVDLSFGSDPRLFSFKELNSDPVLLAIAYTQVLAAIRRDSLLDDSPRIIAVDEVYRLLKNESLLDFMVEGTKTLRTQQKKLLLIDQQLSIFVDDKTDRTGKLRLVFENCPIRVIFNQREGLETLKNDSAFTHYHENHFEIIRQLDRGQFIFDAEGRGLQACYFRPSRTELARFGGS
jgi:type IV secretory pathway VirB4 component